MKVIGRAGIGLDNVDLAAATKKGIVVMNTPQENAIAAAEHTIAMMFSISRKIPQATASMKAGKWEKKKFMGVELYNKIFGIVGIGVIGTIVADRAKALKMKVIAYDPYISKEAAEKKGIDLVSFDELLERSDFISVHTPLTDETRNLIDKSAFRKMKTGVIILNCARGGIINEKDLYDAIKEGKVAGAALDVFEKEPAVGNPLFESGRSDRHTPPGRLHGRGPGECGGCHCPAGGRFPAHGGGSQRGEPSDGQPGYPSRSGALSPAGGETGGASWPRFRTMPSKRC